MNTKTEVATFAGGCFWCMQPPYDGIPGVLSTSVGYMGGQTKNPTYDDVCTGQTGHTEVVQITFDPSQISYEHLVEVFWRNIDPTTENGQFADRGSQYRTEIFYHNKTQEEAAQRSKNNLEKSEKFNKKIVTNISAATDFYPAETHHQCYYQKAPDHYNRYKQGSGRADFIEETWGKLGSSGLV